jgi:protease-4
MTDIPSQDHEQPPVNSTWSGMHPDDSWERDILNRLAFATLNEQRRARRWSIFFKILGFAYLFLLLFLLRPEWFNWSIEEDMEISSSSKKHTALVEVQGVIASESEASADKVITGLRAAFKDENTAGIIIRINSPGGSAVQAGYINDEINRLRDKHKDRKLPIYAVVTDLCASGGYYIAVAADQIYADKASVIGSIGVLMDSFGFVGSLEKLGIERRLLTAGEHKGFLDPFSPMKEDEIKHVKEVLSQIHDQFIAKVKQGREKSLKAKDKLKLLDNPTLFSGLVWTGEQAVELGLIDGLGSSSYVARELIKAEKIKDFTPKPNYLDRFAERLGATATSMLFQQFKLNGGTLR